MRDDKELRQIRTRVEISSDSLKHIVDSIVKRYSSEIDAEVAKIRAVLDRREALQDDEVEKFVMRIPVYMYYAASGLENLGIEMDMSSAIRTEVFNKQYIATEGTVKDREAAAKAHTINEHMIEVAYSRAYKKLKLQLEMAEAVYSGAKKVLSKRMIEIELMRNKS